MFIFRLIGGLYIGRYRNTIQYRHFYGAIIPVTPQLNGASKHNHVAVINPCGILSRQQLAVFVREIRLARLKTSIC